MNGQNSSVSKIGSALPTQTGNNGKFLSTDGTSPSWETLAGGGASTFTALTDTPSAYTDQKNKVVAVNEDADEIVFKDMVIDENGNVGIGQGLPETLISKLQIQALSRMGFLLKRTDKFDFVQYQRNAGAWTDITAGATDSYGTVSGDVLDVIGDIFVIGKTNVFDSAYIDIGTARTNTGVLVWEYSLGGNTWATLTCIDNTNALVVDGAVTFTPPVDWATDSQNGSAQMYFIRLRVESGTFTAEPTVFLVAPGDGTNMLEVYANGGDTVPSFLIDNTGGVALGYNDSATHRLRVAGSAQIAGLLAISGALSGATTGAFSSTVTSTPASTTFQTGLSPLQAFRASVAAASALIPVQVSSAVSFVANAWNGAITRLNEMDIILKPSATTPTKARMVWKNRMVDGIANNAELMNLTQEGELTVLGRAQSQLETFDSIWRFVAPSTWTDYTLVCNSFGQVTGDMLDVIGDFSYFGKANPFELIHIILGTKKSATGVLSFQYWDGTAWQTLTVTDGTSGLTVDGKITFTAPLDWAKGQVNTTPDLYWVRIGVASGTFTVEPTFRLALPNSRAIEEEIFTDGEFDGTTLWTPAGDWSRVTAGTYTFVYSTGAGTLTQSKTNFNHPLKPNTWYRFRFRNGVAGPATTQCWIGEEVAREKVYFTTAVATIDVYFQTNSDPQDFVIYTTATTTSNFRLDAVSLLEMRGGEVRATGCVQAEKVLVDDDAYDADWEDNYEVPTKNAIRDKIESLGSVPVEFTLIGDTTDLETTHVAYARIPEKCDGMNLVRATGYVITAGTTNATTFQVRNMTKYASNDALSTAISIASGATLATAGTVNTSYDDVSTNDLIRISVTAVSTTKPKGGRVILEFRKP